MSEAQINTKDYWEERFQMDWETAQGESQTEFFARIACGLFPDWFVRDIKRYRYSICDAGCALGDGVNVLSEFLECSVTGVDFSDVAIQKAQNKFPQYSFQVMDLTQAPDQKQYDIVFSSNVLEHFYEPWQVVGNLSRLAKKYIAILVPFQESMQIEEHVYKFDTHVIPLGFQDFHLIYAASLDAATIENTLYPNPQILLLYSSDKEDQNFTTLQDLAEHVQTRAYVQLMQENERVLRLHQEQRKLLEEQAAQMEQQVQALAQQAQALERQNRERGALQHEITKAHQLAEQRQKEVGALQQELHKLRHSFSWRVTKIFRLLGKASGISRWRYAKRGEGQRTSFGKRCYTALKRSRFGQATKKIIPKSIKKKLAGHYAASLVAGSMPEESVLRQFVAQVNQSGEPIMLVFSGVKYVDSEGQRNIRLVHEAMQKNMKIIFAYWRWDISEPVIPASTSMLQIPIDYLYQNRVSLFTDIFQFSAQRTLLVEFPHEYALDIVDIANCHGWTTVYDVIDDWEEFAKKGQAIWYDKRVEIGIANVVDINVATAALLQEKIAAQMHHPEPYYRIGNGVDPNRIKPSPRLDVYNCSRGSLQIGYFGHLTDSWFDWKMLCRIAKKRPEWTFHLIGYGEPSDLQTPDNIRLYGKKTPEELPKYAAFWDVAIIPFINGELTRSVNPIKVYEYLQLLLPVVASNMPEIKDYPYTQITMQEAEFEAAIARAATMHPDPNTIEAFVAENTWARKWDALWEAIQAFDPSKSYKVIFSGGTQ